MQKEHIKIDRKREQLEQNEETKKREIANDGWTYVVDVEVYLAKLCKILIAENI